MKRLAFCLVFVSFLLFGGNAFAFNIIIANDDGFESPNINALHTALRAAGHDAVICAPFDQQSGKSSSLNHGVPDVETDSPRTGIVPAGSVGHGLVPGETSIYYVNGTPVMAALYGIDIIAQERWGKNPDLVISGPNEGRNLGAVINYSGTCGAAVGALRRGIPAMATSAFWTTDPEWNDPAVVDLLSVEVAAMIVNIVAELEAKAGDGALLPDGIGLNVNIPGFLPGEGSSLEVRFTQVGTYSDYWGYVGDNAYVMGASKDEENNVSVTYLDTGLLPAEAETNPNAEIRFTQGDGDWGTYMPLEGGTRGYITISTIDGDYNAKRRKEELVKLRLNGLLPVTE